MYWTIGILGFLAFNVFVFAFIYGAGKQDDVFDNTREEFNGHPELKVSNNEIELK